MTGTRQGPPGEPRDEVLDTQDPSAPRPATEAAPIVLPILACQVCGHSALRAEELYDGAPRSLGSRLVCQVCGAHRVTST